VGDPSSDDLEEGDGDCFQVCRNGEGTTGVVGLTGTLRWGAEGFTPFGWGAFSPSGALCEDGRVGVVVGNRKASAALVGEGAGAAERTGAEPPLGVGDEDDASSPTRRRFVSVLIGSIAFSGLSRKTKRPGEGRGEGPKAGE